MTMDKKTSRLRRARRARAKIRELGVHRLTIHRTPRHMYAQVIDPDGEKVLASASTIDKGVKAELEGSTGNRAAAGVVGKLIAERAKAAGVEQVAFDRSGFKYHGRVKALADAARENGLQF
jgi:large subunit ribosomal protein L18